MEILYTKNKIHDDLVARVQAGDDAAFVQLCENYRPLYFKYFIKNQNLNYTANEWYQQMQIFTYDLQKKYNLTSERTFGSFLNVGLGYRIIDLQRSLQKKQTVFETAVIVLDANVTQSFVENNSQGYGINGDDVEKSLEINDILESFVISLSEAEQEVFFYLIGQRTEISLEPGMEKKLTIRLKRKLKTFLE